MSCCIIGCPNEGPSASKDTTYHLFPHPTKDASRFKQWIDACNNPRIQKLDAVSVHKRYRICRRHFDADCLNGGCRRLLNTAVPTLYLNPSTKHSSKSEARNSSETAPTEIIYLPIAVNDSDDHFELVIENKAYDQQMLNTSAPNKRKSEENQPSRASGGNKYGYLREIHTKHKIKKLKTEPEEEEDEEEEEEEVINKDDSSLRNLSASNELEMQYELLDVEDAKYYKAPLTDEALNQWRKDFYKCEKNVLAQNICTRIDPFEAALSRKALENIQHVFTYKVESEGKPLTNQKSSGRCWLFAALNAIRIPFIRNYNLDEFEFSQTYLFYWDKIERCHYFLNNIIETAAKGEEVTGRVVSFLLKDPTSDGGQWDMVVNLIKKHGLMPKKCYPETYCSEASVRMNAILKSKLREYSKILRDLVIAGSSEDDVKAKLNEQMRVIYNVVGICLGIPSETFTWEYNDKSKSYHCIKSIRPIDFYEKHVKPYFDVDNKVCIVTDPRPTNTYGQAYTVEYLGNVIGGRPVLYNNQPVELLMELVTNSLKNGEPVWFGCEVSKRFAAKQGIEDLTIHDFKLLLGVDIQVTLSKADRMIYGESAMTHAMTFTAVSCDDDGKSTKFRVENSWGEDRGEKGYLIMSADWFKEFVFEIVVDKSIVPKDVLDVFNQTPIVLPAWDPMGTLAKS